MCCIWKFRKKIKHLQDILKKNIWVKVQSDNENR